jgi:hypothetical protein
MLSLVNWSEIADSAPGVSAIVTGMTASNEVEREKRKYSLPAKLPGGLALIAPEALRAILPQLYSPEVALEGAARGFHEVHKYRSAHFEFSITTQPEPRTSLKADYFDKGFYFGHPSVSDGVRFQTEMLLRFPISPGQTMLRS